MANETKSKSLQDRFLFDLVSSKNIIIVTLINGIILHGKILRFDNFSLELEYKNNTKIIYKHSVAYIEKKNKK